MATEPLKPDWTGRALDVAVVAKGLMATEPLKHRHRASPVRGENQLQKMATEPLKRNHVYGASPANGELQKD